LSRGQEFISCYDADATEPADRRAHKPVEQGSPTGLLKKLALIASLLTYTHNRPELFLRLG
jgi:hypothetical protein